MGKAKDPDYFSKYSKAHAEQKREERKRYYARHKDDPEFMARMRRNSINSLRKKAYGISPEKYAEMVEAQHGECAICHAHHGDGLYVDHDHKTGEVRGLLCNACNVGIGRFNDDPELLKKALEFLKTASV